MRIFSNAFADGGPMPAVHATRQVAGGANVSPRFDWDRVPAGTRSFALAMVDLHPVAHGWVHWLVVDVPGDVRGLAEGASNTSSMPYGARELAGTRGERGYSGPQPPPGTGDHPYQTRLFALDVARLDIPDGASLTEVETAVVDHVLATATTTGLFGR
jgi:Raf kinase inhibitor-like YbhB/YbcL family protein